MGNNIHRDTNRVYARPVITHVDILDIEIYEPYDITVKGYGFWDNTKVQKYALDTNVNVAPLVAKYRKPWYQEKLVSYENDVYTNPGKELFDIVSVYVSANCVNMWTDDYPVSAYDLYSHLVKDWDRSPTLAERFPPFSAYKIEDDKLTINSENELVFELPPPQVAGLIDVIVANRAGYGKCSTVLYPGNDQQRSDQTARFTTGISSSGLLVVGQGFGCIYAPAPPVASEWF